jgi:aquaporin Z
MRAMNIRVVSGQRGINLLKASFRKNWIHYLQEALGIAIFMISACFFTVLLWGNNRALHFSIMNENVRFIVMGAMMGLTALYIFYSPITAQSGSHINPAVTITFLRLNKISRCDAMFYVISQFIGGTLAVRGIAFFLGNSLSAPPVNYAITVPGKFGILPAAVTEYTIALVTMMMVLFTSNNENLKKFTRIFSGCLVCCWVILAGPISGFGMNPARSFASAFSAHIYTAFWIYLIVPVAGMLSAAEIFLMSDKQKGGITSSHFS